MTTKTNSNFEATSVYLKSATNFFSFYGALEKHLFFLHFFFFSLWIAQKKTSIGSSCPLLKTPSILSLSTITRSSDLIIGSILQTTVCVSEKAKSIPNGFNVPSLLFTKNTRTRIPSFKKGLCIILD